MTKNFILALVLIMIFMFVYELFVFKPAQRPVKSNKKTFVQEVKEEAGKTLKERERPGVVSPIEDTLVVQTESYIIRLTSKSGRLVGFVPVKYQKEKESLELLANGPDAGLLALKVQGLKWQGPVVKDTLRIKGSDSLTLNFNAYLNDTLVATKRLTFRSDNYLVKVAIKVKNLGKPALYFSGLNLTEKNRKDDLHYASFVYSDGKLHRISYGKLKEIRSIDLKGVDWVGARTKYFLLGVSIKSGNPDRVIVWRSDYRIPFKLLFKDSLTFRMYLGPIDYFVLKSQVPEMAGTFDFGASLIAPFSRVIFYLMHFFYRYIPNYGWVIVILALLMKLVFYPLTMKSLKSMKKMQELKPKMDALRKIYKDDPQRLQKEMMELYKKYKVNPFSGCLPLLLQIPIFWALYQILRISIDLRGAPFILWIKDLSVHDPYYILPILMGVASLAQSWIQSGADQQSRMMALFMPIFITVIFLKFPAGIVLYWLAYNIFSLVESLLLWRAKR